MTKVHWQVASFTAPCTTAANSVLVIAPPWFYAGWLGLTVLGATHVAD